ncbi:MAG: HEAT repeat domain-containing protein, partial [Myxococcota bacterium]|nr:HEAT repeat domain-containing protein [Myxococcota bacterium]
MTESLTLDIVNRLRKRLHDASPQVRQAAATGLAALSPDIFPDVIRDDEAMARVSAIEYLAQTQRLEASQLQVAIQGLSDTGIAAAIRAASHMPVASETWTIVAECLQHHAPEVRIAAAETLGDSMAAQWIEPLIACLGDSIVRQAALDSLARLGWSPDSPEGQATLALASRDFTRLGTFADAAIPQIEAAFRAGGRDRDSVELRAALCGVIAPVASKHVDRLLAECLNDVGSAARAAAARALGTRGKSVKKTVRSSLRALLDGDPNARVRLAAAVTLGQLQDAAAVDALEAASTHDESAAVRYAASEALGHLGHHEHLIRALGSPEATIRRDAAQQLGELKVYAAIDPLIDTLTDTMATVRSAAFNALEILGWTPVGVKIGPTDERYSRWMTRAEQLHRAGLDASNPVDQAALLAMDLQAPDPLVRQAALEALANRKDKKLKTLALPLLDDSDPYVRTCAAETVLRLDAVPASGPLRASWLVATGQLAEAATLGPDATAALSREAREGTSDRRAEAVRVMAPLEGEEITSTLHAALHDDVSFVRTNAILSLSVRGEPSAIEALQALLGDDHSVIRRTAGQCLLRLGDSGIEAAQQSLNHDDALVRQTVADAIAANAEVANTLVIRLHTALDNETASTVQEALLYALGAAEDNAAPFWTSAARLLRDSPHYKVRLAAAAALGRLRVADASSALCEALGDTYVSVRKAALDALPQVGWKASGPTARAMVALAEEDWRELSSVGTASIPLLRQTLNESSADGPSVRRREYAIQALVEIGKTLQQMPDQVRAIRDILLERLHDVGGRARAAAARGLGVLDAGEVGQALLQVAQHDANEHARVSALIALGRCGDKEMSEALLAISRTDASQNVRIAASQALAGPAIGDIASLILALSSPDAPVRQRAAMELGGLDNPEAIDPLIERLGDADTGVRAAARRSLNTLGWEPVGIRGGHDEPGYRRWLS